MFTENDVKLVWFAHCTDVSAAANQGDSQTWEDAVYEQLWQLAELSPEPRQYLESLMEEYEEGQRILEHARLLIGNRYQRFTSNPDPLESPDAPTIKISSGHIATTEAVREVTLEIKRLSVSEAAERYNVPTDTVRYAARNGFILNAERQGKLWFFPQRDFLHWLSQVHRPRS